MGPGPGSTCAPHPEFHSSPPPTAHRMQLDYTVNNGRWPWEHVHPRTMERLLRRLARLPSRPVILSLQMHTFHQHQVREAWRPAGVLPCNAVMATCSQPSAVALGGWLAGWLEGPSFATLLPGFWIDAFTVCPAACCRRMAPGISRGRNAWGLCYSITKCRGSASAGVCLGCLGGWGWDTPMHGGWTACSLSRSDCALLVEPNAAGSSAAILLFPHRRSTAACPLPC